MRLVPVSTKPARKKATPTSPTGDKLRSLCEEAYWNHVLEHGTQPSSIYRFCKDLGIREKDFYDEFSHFDAIESGFWESTVHECLAALETDEDAPHYPASQWLSAFYFTYFEIAVEHRSKFLARFPRLREGKSARLRGWHRAFDQVADTFISKTRHEGSPFDQQRIISAQKRAVVFQARSLVDFHLADTSPKFEDTDALIEKSVRFVSEAARLSLLDSSIDLLRFLLPRLAR